MQTQLPDRVCLPGLEKLAKYCVFPSMMASLIYPKKKIENYPKIRIEFYPDRKLSKKTDSFLSKKQDRILSKKRIENYPKLG